MAKKSAGKKTKVEDNIRAVKFNEFLIDKGITVFSTESMEDEAFDAELIYGMLSTVVQHLQEHIAELMEQIWSQ